jgi:hypothetical protein
VFGYRFSLVLQSGVSDVFENPHGDVEALVADVYLTTYAGDIVNVNS